MDGREGTDNMDLSKVGNRISEARKQAALTQEQLADQIGVSVQAVSKWENGHNLPDIENLMLIAEITNKPYGFFLDSESEGEKEYSFLIRDRLFQEDNMFTRLRSTASAEKLDETYRALQYIRERHAGQFRKLGIFSKEKVLYINHPLLMACHAHALGIRDDALLASILLHDVVEDTGVTKEELPFSDEVKTIVGLVSFSVPAGKSKEESKEEYYKKISENGKACVVKIIDRCNNVSTMAGSFSKEKLEEYINETEKYVLPLTTVLKNQYPEYSELSFVVKYQIIGVLETIKNMLLR